MLNVVVGKCEWVEVAVEVKKKGQKARALAHLSRNKCRQGQGRGQRLFDSGSVTYKFPVTTTAAHSGHRTVVSLRSVSRRFTPHQATGTSSCRSYTLHECFGVYAALSHVRSLATRGLPTGKLHLRGL